MRRGGGVRVERRWMGEAWWKSEGGKEADWLRRGGGVRVERRRIGVQLADRIAFNPQ